MGTPALARTRLTIGVLMAAGTLATGGIAGALAVTPPGNAEAADQLQEELLPSMTPSQSAMPTPSATKTKQDDDDAAEKKTKRVTTTKRTTTTTTPKKKKTVSKPKATKAPAPAPKPAPKPAPAPTKTKGS